MGINDSALLAAIDMVSAGILGLAFIALVVFAILASKTWHWVNVVFVILTFMAGVGAIWGLTQVYSLRKDAMNDFKKWKEQLEANLAEAELKTYGEITSTSYDPGTLRAVSEELSRVMQGRGRVWSGGQVVAENDLRVFTFATPRPADVQPLQDVVLFAFLESQVGGQSYPARYIGSVRVKEETPESVKVELVALADPGEFAQPTGTWSLFEKMPLDRRSIFKNGFEAFVEGSPNASARQLKFVENLAASRIKNSTTDLDIAEFRAVLTSIYLSADKIGLDPKSREYEQLIDRYAFDGLSLGKIQTWIENNPQSRVDQRFDPPPEEVFILYRFDEKSKRSYQVDANGSIDADGLFTPLGQAVDPALHAGKQIDFAKGDTVLVDQRTADGYQRNEQQVAPFKQNESVTEVDRIYRRQVRDFPYEFADIRAQAARVVIETARIRENNKVNQATFDNAKAQQSVRDGLISDLDADNMNLKNDLDTITALYEQKSQQNSDLKQQIASLERKIDASYAELRSLAVTQSKKAFSGE